MCRVCVALGSLAARGAPVLLRDSLPAAARGSSVQALRQLGCHAKGLHTRALSPSAAHALRNWPASSAWTTLRGFACRTKFDAPPPKMVLVEYDPAEVDSFIALADAIEDEFPDVQVEGNMEGVTPRRGAFEVTTGDGNTVLFSRLQAGRRPNPGEVVDAIKLRVPGVGTITNAGEFGGCA